jgi:membrane protease YdiL (CAAX protease family)
MVAAGWLVLVIGLDLILVRLLPGVDERWASLWIILAISVLIAAGVTWVGWWREVGYTPPAEWRNLPFLLVPAFITLVPLFSGIKALDASTFGLLIAGYALTGFAEETVYRGVMVKLLERRSPIMIATITAILFGLVHLGNIVVRGEVAIIFAQAVGAAAFGFGFAAFRLKTNALLPLVVLHAIHDLFLQMGNWPLIPVAVAQDIVLFAVGLYFLRPGRNDAARNS